MATNEWWPKSWERNFNYPDLSPYAKSFFDDQPQVTWEYVTAPAQQYGSVGFRNYLAGNMNKYLNRYTSDLALNRVTPETDFHSWLTQTSQFNPWSDFQQLSPYERGERQSIFQGRGRWVP